MIGKMYLPTMNGCKVFVAVSDDVASDYDFAQLYQGTHFDPITNEKGHIGWTFDLEGGNLFMWVNATLPQSPGIAWDFNATAAHEAFHVAMRCAEHINAHEPRYAEEPLAYLVSALVQTATTLKRLMDGRKSDKLITFLQNELNVEIIKEK